MKIKRTSLRSPVLARDFSGRRPFTGGSLAASRQLQSGRYLRSRGLRSVTLFVPESCAEGLRDLLRARERDGIGDPLSGWRRVSPSTELMVDVRSAARGTIRDTRAQGAEGYYWAVTLIGETEPVASGRSEELTEARSQAEQALNAYLSGGGLLHKSEFLDWRITGTAVLARRRQIGLLADAGKVVVR
jgi:hypothetical protein